MVVLGAAVVVVGAAVVVGSAVVVMVVVGGIVVEMLVKVTANTMLRSGFIALLLAAQLSCLLSEKTSVLAQVSSWFVVKGVRISTT